MGDHSMNGLVRFPEGLPVATQLFTEILRTWLQQPSPVCTGHTNDPIGMWLG